jgi:hypothetical protein
MSTPMFCLALRPLHDSALRQTLLVDSQPIKPLEAANPCTGYLGHPFRKFACAARLSELSWHIRW